METVTTTSVVYLLVGCAVLSFLAVVELSSRLLSLTGRDLSWTDSDPTIRRPDKNVNSSQPFSNSWCRKHIAISTFKCPHSPSCEPTLRPTIEANVRHALQTMDPNLLALWEPDLNDHHNQVQVNAFGVPVLKSLFQVAKEQCPDAVTYSYVNGDILLRHDFVDTLEAVASHAFLHNSNEDDSTSSFLVVGKRKNANWRHHNTSASDPFFDYQERFRRARLFHGQAQDYFVVNNKFDWSDIPPFVIGRAGYDNWLVDYAYHHPNVHLVDATSTLSAMHMTDMDGNMAWGGPAIHVDDALYNYQFANGQFDHGTIQMATYKTVRWASNGTVGVTYAARKRMG